jgi:hypothetical protein
MILLGGVPSAPPLVEPSKEPTTGGVPSAPPLVEPSKEPTTAPAVDDEEESESEDKEEEDEGMYEGMSDYERQRERKITRNKARLVELGLDTIVMKKLPSTKKSKVSTSGPLSHPTRRSERISNEGEVPSASQSEMHSNDDFCFICKVEGGTLICCDKCVKAFHEGCLGLDPDFLPDTWFCPSCCTGESAEGGVPSASPLVEQLRTTRGGNSIGRNGYKWTTDDEQQLLIWFNESHDQNARIDYARIDFTEISRIIGRSQRACLDKLRVIINSGVLTQDVIDGFIVRFRNYVYTQDVPKDMRIESLANADGSIVSFKKWQDEGASAFHITQVPPHEMSIFSKESFIQLNPSLRINQNYHNLLDSLNGRRCIIADNFIRQPGVHDFAMTPNPHIKHPTTGVFRTKVHDCVYLCNFFFFALHKYRSANDREKWYNFGRGIWSESCYMYIIKNEETIRSGFSEVGIGIGESPDLEAFGKSQFPVQYDGCYKINWNGRGIANASFNYINM